MQMSEAAAAWLASNPEAAALVDEVILRVQETFGDCPQIILKDVPAGCLYERSTVRYRMVIRFRNYEFDDKTRLRFLDDAWWMDNMRRAGSQLSFRLEFWYGELAPESVAVEARPL